MTRIESALAGCDRLIAGYEVAPGGHMALAMLRIGRDVLTRHVPARGTDYCEWCRVPTASRAHPSHDSWWPCADVEPWLELLAPEADA